MIHRDIKPHNILLTDDGSAKVVDFGIARAAASSTTLTLTGEMLGTAHYISPEQVMGEPATPRSDLYSLGVVLYEMLTGELPYDAETPIGIAMKHVNGHLLAPEVLNPQVPADINAVTCRLLSKDPEDRYPDAQALLKDLERLSRSQNRDGVATEPPVPDGGAKGSAAIVAQNTDPPTVEVPDLSWLNRFEANGTLAGVGLKLGGQSEAPSNAVSVGRISEQEPRAGMKVKRGSSVSVTVSTGPSRRSKKKKPLERVRVPNLVGKNAPVASGILKDAGLRYDFRNLVQSDAPKGAVIGQTPQAGTEVDRNSTVAVTVSAGRMGAPQWAVLAGFVAVVVVLVVVVIALQGGPGGEPLPEASPEAEPVSEAPPEEFTLTSTLTGHSDQARSVAFSPGGNLLASGGFDGTVKLWDPQSGEEIRTLEGRSSSVGSVAFSPDGRLLASGDSDGDVKLWDPQSGEEIRTLTDHFGSILSVAFSPDGNLLASGGFDGTVKLWDPQSGEEIRTLTGHDGFVVSVAFSPDGSTVASGSSNITRANRPDGSTVASGNSDRTVKLWDPQSGEELQTLSQHSGPDTSVAFSPDGNLLASSSLDGAVKLWDLQSGEEFRTLVEAYSGAVRSVAFSPDGSLLASGNEDKTVKLWDPRSGEVLQTLTGHSDDVRSVAFSPDGRLLASGDSDGDVKLWERED